jgi:hypothetical protein
VFRFLSTSKVCVSSGVVCHYHGCVGVRAGVTVRLVFTFVVVAGVFVCPAVQSPMKETPTHTTIIILSLPVMIQQDFCKFEGTARLCVAAIRLVGI